ncbi:hypothetical protein O6H91_20G022600 [Diphasiastrum complanatum]|uniref:Uncharacterized protein n=2 Tax=Diphasiastrum complanatum TaxID=34168 RepID=A0ACC2ANM2_DIPCM|nr:hypothetical protein O6H91_Y474500 [Diphasiastrum complanatum]KAJ7519096.1 hypothetical protein O6H91_20G022600 [Diphasiastrum complanatum]KAJ7519099.1 hypothetical protein O6H91_20G022600 [Diphasiastrum complanatum]
MASTKMLSRTDGFERKGQAWFCTTGLPSDIVVEVKEMSFHLHKFPLMSRSGKLASLIAEIADDEDDVCTVQLPDVPGGTEAFELAAKFCYGVKLELTSDNVVSLRCAAEYLEMTEEFGAGNLIAKTENYLNQVIYRSWKDSFRALQRCESVLPHAEELQIVKKCIDSIVMKACTDPRLFGWPITDLQASMQSPGGSILWNGINTGARPRKSRSGWWYEDVAAISLPLFEKIIAAMEVKGLRTEIIAGAVMHYARKWLPGLNRRHDFSENERRSTAFPLDLTPSNVDQRVLLETLESLLPMQKGLTSSRLLFGLLRLAMILNASAECKSSLERRIGAQLEQATLDDLLLPNYSYSVETLYDIETVQRILDHFLILNGRPQSPSSIQSFEEAPAMSSPSVTPLMRVAALMDAYLAEVAPDANLKLEKFQSLAEGLPDFSRVLDDGLYRAIDLYLKAHSWLTELERERLCKIMDCHKLSLEACTHAAQNERLPLRVVIQVLFFEQLQLRTAITGCFLVADNADVTRQPQAPVEIEGSRRGSAALHGNGWAHVLRQNQAMKIDMDRMRAKVNELEGECTEMRREIQKLGKGRIPGVPSMLSKKSGCSLALQVCNSHKKERNDRNAQVYYSRHSTN